MGVEFIACNYCGETFPDCGDFEYCECGVEWCSLECAEEEGYRRSSCTSGYSEGECDREYCSSDCENYIGQSCKFCREEDFEDDELLGYLLELTSKTREELIVQYREHINK